MKRIRNIIAISVVAFGFGGCLKDVSRTMDVTQSNNVIEFANTANLTSPTTSKYPLIGINVLMQPSGTYNAVISYSGANDAPEDIKVTVGDADPAVLAAYNTQNKTTYTHFLQQIIVCRRLLLPFRKVNVVCNSRFR